MKYILKKALVLMLAVLMAVSSVPAFAVTVDDTGLAELSASGTSGNGDLFTEAHSTTPSISVDKNTYSTNEPIYVTANNGNWVGLYKGTQDTYHNGIYSIYWYYVDGYEGRAFNIKTGTYNGNNHAGVAPELGVGTYTAILFDSGNNILTSVSFYVEDGNGDTDDANNYLSTDKYEYFYGENIIITAKTTNKAANNSWVGVYEKGKTGSNYMHWFYLVTNSYNYQGASVSLYGAAEAPYKNVHLAAGKEYDIYLYSDGGYTVAAKTTIRISGATVRTDKDTYGLGEDITVTAASNTHTTGAWVGLYKVSELGGGKPNGNVPSRAWYYLYQDLNSNGVQDSGDALYNNSSIVMQDLISSAFSTPLTDLEAGEYVVYVFGNSGYNDIQNYTYFTVENKVNAAFTDGAYTVDNLSDGFANGEVALKISSDYYSAIGNTDAAVYWADANGTPIPGYTSLAKTKIDANVITFDMYTHTFIPEGAASLVAYVSYEGTDGTEGLRIALPDGCATYTGIDDDIITEFQMVSDIHVTSDRVSSYEDGRTLINSWHHDYDNQHFEMMLEDIAANSPASTGIFINGDIANNGLKAEFEEVASIYDTVDNQVGGTLPDMFVSLGNHDSYPGDISEFVNYANSLGANISTTAPYYAKDIEGYKYIFLAGDNSAYYGKDIASENSNDAELSQTQLEWLDAQLKDNEQNNDGKPVFVMLHQAIKNTVAGSFEGQDWDGVVNIDALKAVLNKYNNVILLGGHSHWEINSPNNMFAGTVELPVAVNTASVGYLWTEYNGVAGGEYMPGSQGFYVRTYEDKVVFLGRDFENQLWIPSACYVMDNVEDYTVESKVMNIDDTMTASEYVTNDEGRELSYFTSDNNIIAVDENGTLTATGLGTAYITVVAEATDTEIITRQKVPFTVTNQTVSEDIAAELGKPLNLGESFSAYIGIEQNGTEYFLTIPGDGVSTDRTSTDYSASQGFSTSNDMTVYYPEFMQKDNKNLSVRQFWDFERQNDGTYIIFNTWTNATHDAYNPKVPYALDGGSYSYYRETIPTDDNNVDNALTATRYYYTDEDYTSDDGIYSSYYRWYIYMDNDGNYYLKSQHTGYILALNMYNDQHWFGSLDKVLNSTQRAAAAMALDRISTKDNIKMSLFDYGKYINNDSYIAKEARKFRETGVSTFDASKNDNILWFNQDAWNENYVVDGVATTNEADKASDMITVDNIGNPSQYDSTPLMLNSLDSTGYPYVNNVTYHDWDRLYGSFDNYPAFGSDSGSLKYLFDEDMTYVTGDENSVLTEENYKNGYYQSVRYDVGDAYGSGMFKESSTGGMVYSSYMNAAYFDTSAYYANGYYQPVSGQRFQIYDYVIRPFYHYYYSENVSYTDSDTGTTYNNIYDTLIKSTRLDTFGEDSLFNNRYLRKSLRDYNSYNRNFLPFNYGHNMTSEHIAGEYITDSLFGYPVDPVYPDEFTTTDRTGYSTVQQDTPQLPAYFNETYADARGSSYTNSQETNLWFGMSMEFDFEIANNGQIYDMNGNLQDMVFNFTGDDDVLVYIDNVLVLNVAGTHGAQMATINFATGNVAHPTDESCYPAVGIDTSESSTIREKFETAYAEAGEYGSNSILAGTTLNEDIFEGNTFANGTRHTLKFFYLERGGSRSFCDIYFNMETLPSSGFEVEKQVTDAEGNDVADKDNSDYTFVITGYTSDNEVLTSGTYTYDIVDTSTNAVVDYNLSVKQNGSFSIKGGQKAVFKDLDVATQYTVTEIVDPCYVTNVRTFLNGTEIGNMPTTQEHLVYCMASSYIPVVENDLSNVTFVNAIDVVGVDIKYYDREVVSGKPADMGSEPKTFVYKFYGSDIIFTDDTHSEYDTAQMIADAGMALESGNFGGVNNLLDDYYLWLSQDQAVEGMQNIVNTHTGKNYVETPYHTDHYGNVQTSGEKWVEISEDGKQITSWMFNAPKEYKIYAYGYTGAPTDVLTAISGTDKYVADGTQQIITAYYNQRLGGKALSDDINVNEGVDGNANYLANYGIDAIAQGKVKTNKTATANGKTLNFQYWAYDEKGETVASTDIDYLYRVSGDATLYAIYGEGEAPKGMTVTQNQMDVYSVAGSNGASVEYVRLNTVMNPYGYDDNFHVGGTPEGNDGIKEVAIAYINVKNASFDVDNLTDAQLQELRAGVQKIMQSASANSFRGILDVTVEATTDADTGVTVEGGTYSLVANGFKYQVVTKESAGSNTNQVYLTTKNRIQFTTSFTKAQLRNLRLFAFAAMKVTEGGTTQWVVSDNYVDYNLGAQG